MKKDLLLLKKLTEANGIGGHERMVRQIMEEEFLQVVSKDDILYDGLGSIAARKVGQEDGPKIAIAGHMDEIGMIVTKITDEGFLKFQTIGGWWSQVMLAQQMTVTTSEGKTYRGVIGSKPPHILSESELKNPVKIEDMYLDLGVASKEEVEKLGIKVGDMITPAIDFQVLANEKYLLAKAWDNRIGCAVAIEVLKQLKGQKHPNTVYGIGTVQEEVGLRGARTIAQMINPDIVIAVDVGIAKDVPGTDNSAKLGAGPQILLYDGALIGHVGLREFIVGIADELKIPYQFDYLKRGGTDAGAMHLVHDGAPAMSLCIPSRYIHSHTSIIHKDDFDNTVKLLVEVIKRLDNATCYQITYK
ncbi:MAG TPA: M42 family metallopeptidase [Bacilli bacterium]|nr:M42 family metallopeptidase [Bacilli bacterium]HPT89877.1 M42 family metallopeptidase [Bacilli bacterium]HQA19588.1 M42 family metallopeptidase [Bacilli bacterium]HQD92347.1 M42 family metallopeptidase [Bacilli bacterium]